MCFWSTVLQKDTFLGETYGGAKWKCAELLRRRKIGFWIGSGGIWEQSWMGSAYLGEAGPTPIFLTYLAFGRDRIGPALFCCEQLGMAGHLAFYRFFARSYGG